MFRSMGKRAAMKSNGDVNSSERTTRRRTYRSESPSVLGSVVGAFSPGVSSPPASPRSTGRSNPLMSANRASTSAAARITQLRIDVPLLLSVIALLIFGIVMVYSASYDYSLRWYGDPSTIFTRQLMWLALGISVAVFLMFFDYHLWRTLAVWIMGLTLALLLAVLFMNQVLNGAARTLIGGSVQPSELSKLVTVIYLSVWLFAKRDQLSDVSFGLFPLAGIIGVMGGMIILQPDLSAVVTIFMLGGLMFFLAGGDLKQIVILLAFAILVGWGIVAVNRTGSERLKFYFAGLKDPSEGSYHVRRSFEAFVKGGWFGVGIGKGVVKLTGLPVPPTDSIFAVVGEETGVFGSLTLLGLYVVFLWRGIVVARRAPDQMGALLAAGLTLWISFEAFVNMAVMLNLVPFAGNALPLISAGGSNLVVTMAAVGILLNVSRLSAKGQERNDGTYAFIDLRGRDRWRGVPGAGRPTGAARNRE